MSQVVVRFKGCAGRRWSGGRLVGLKHDLALEKYASPARSRTPPMQKKSHWTVPAPALLSSPMQPSAKAPQQSLTVAGGPGVRILAAPAASQRRTPFQGRTVASSGNITGLLPDLRAIYEGLQRDERVGRRRTSRI